MSLLKGAIEILNAQGVSVMRADFPPEPLPGLYTVNGHELTEMQVIDYASRQQQPLGEPFASVLRDNLWSMYEKS